MLALTGMKFLTLCHILVHVRFTKLRMTKLSVNCSVIIFQDVASIQINKTDAEPS